MITSDKPGFESRIKEAYFDLARQMDFNLTTITKLEKCIFVLIFQDIVSSRKYFNSKRDIFMQNIYITLPFFKAVYFL